MVNFYGKTGKKLHILQLTKGDYLLEEIQKVIDQEQIVNGIVTTGLGTLDRCTMHSVVTLTMPVENRMRTWQDEPIGVAAMSGIIANGQPHIHMVISTYTGREQAFTGHLEPGCRVLCRMEVAILELEGLALERALDENGVEILRQRAGAAP